MKKSEYAKFHVEIILLHFLYYKTNILDWWLKYIDALSKIKLIISVMIILIWSVFSYVKIRNNTKETIYLQWEIDVKLTLKFFALGKIQYEMKPNSNRERAKNHFLFSPSFFLWQCSYKYFVGLSWMSKRKLWENMK